MIRHRNRLRPRPLLSRWQLLPRQGEQGRAAADGAGRPWSPCHKSRREDDLGGDHVQGDLDLQTRIAVLSANRGAICVTVLVPPMAAYQGTGWLAVRFAQAAWNTQHQIC